VSVETFLKQRAVNIAVNGSYSLQRRWYDADGKLRSFACRTTRVSPFRMLVQVPVVGYVGERMTSYFRDFGEVEGVIRQAMRGSFLVDLEMSAAHRARMAEKLAWLEKKFADASVQDAREDARIIPPASHSVMILADGSIHGCFIIDISSSGVGISAEVQPPPIGTPLAIGACVGRVIRIFETGFAVKFVERQNVDDLSRLIVAQPRGSASSADDPADGPVDEQSAKCA
jgi:hypothetical protein